MRDLNDASFEWNENKRLANVDKHGVDLLDAALIFENETLEAPDERDYGEERVKAVGHADGTFYVVYTWRVTSRRLITAWKAGRHDEQRYQERLARRDQADEGAG